MKKVIILKQLGQLTAFSNKKALCNYIHAEIPGVKFSDGLKVTYNQICERFKIAHSNNKLALVIGEGFIIEEMNVIR